MAAFLLYGFYALSRLQRLGAESRPVALKLLLVILSTLAGIYLPVLLATGFHVLQTGRMVWVGRESVLTGLLAGVVAAVAVRSRKRPLGRILDLGILPFPLALAVARLGCLSAGCCYGTPTASWIGLYLPDIQGLWLNRYPTQLLSLISDLIIFFFLLGMERHGRRVTGKPDGYPFPAFTFWMFVFLFALKRFFIQFLRFDYQPVAGILSWIHLGLLAALILSGTALIRGWFSIFLKEKN